MPKTRIDCFLELFPFYDIQGEIELQEKAIASLYHDGNSQGNVRLGQERHFTGQLWSIQSEMMIAHLSQRELLLKREIRSRPWQNVRVDLCHFQNHEWTISVFFSKSPRLDSTTLSSVTQFLRINFTWHGIPEIVISDYVPQFSSASRWDILHWTSSPYHS